RRFRIDDSADRTQHRDPGEGCGTVPSVDGESERAADTSIVEWLLLMVRCGDVTAVQIALLNRDLVSEGADELVARRGRQVAEIDRGAVAADGIDPYGLLGSINPSEAIKERQPLLVIIRILHSLDRLAGFDRSKLERPRAQYVFLIPARILV